MVERGGTLGEEWKTSVWSYSIQDRFRINGQSISDL